MLLLMQVFAFGACDSGETQKDVDSVAKNTVITLTEAGYYNYVISSTTTFKSDNSFNVFIFCSSSAKALRFKRDEVAYNITSPPFACGSSETRSEFTVETHVKTDVIVFVVYSSICQSGAYLMAGGTKVEMQAEVNATRGTSYCVFSPSTDGQEVEVTYGMSKYIDGTHWAMLRYYTDLQQTDDVVWYKSEESKLCMHRGNCKERLENAAFYVEYRVANDSEMFYSRKNLHGSDKFCGCADAQVQFYGRSYSVPFDTFWAKKDCVGSNIGLYVGIGIGCVVGLGVIIAAVVLVFNPKARQNFFGSFKRKKITDDNISASLAPYMETDGGKGVDMQRGTFMIE